MMFRILHKLSIGMILILTRHIILYGRDWGRPMLGVVGVRSGFNALRRGALNMGHCCTCKGRSMVGKLVYINM